MDGFYALYAGRVVAGGIPRHEGLTAAAQSAWTDQQWLSQLILYRAYSWGGYGGVALLAGALVAATAMLLVRLLLRRGVRPVAAASWSLGVVAVVMTTPAVRTQTFAYPLFVIVFGIAIASLSPWRLTPRRAALVVPVLALWANLHGSVVLGAAVAAAAFGYSAVRSDTWRTAAAWLSLGGASLAAVLVTPYGAHIVGYYSSLLGNPVLRAHAGEWRPASVQTAACWPYFALLLVALVAVVRARRQRVAAPPVELVAAAAVAAAGLYGVRFMVWGAIAAAVVSSSSRARGSRRRVRIKPAVTWTLTALVAGGAAAGAVRAPGSDYLRTTSSSVTAAAVRALADNPGAVVLTDQATSARLLWLHPETARRVAFDVRFEQYPRPLLGAYFHFLCSGDRAFADRYAVVAVSTRERPKLVAALRHDPRWRPVYDGPDGFVGVAIHPHS